MMVVKVQGLLHHACYLEDFNDLQLSVHYQYVLLLRLSLSLDNITIWWVDGGSRQETTTSQDYLGHQLTDPVYGAHDITA